MGKTLWPYNLSQNRPWESHRLELGKRRKGVSNPKPQDNGPPSNPYSILYRLFDKRGSIYSSRPPNHIGNELIARNDVHLLLMPYGQAWRNQRKIYQALVSITAVRSLQPIQQAESSLTIHQLAQSLARYYDHIRRYSTGVILSSVFGVRGPEFGHPNITRLYHVQDQFTAILETGATPPVDVVPFLKRLPDFVSPWRRWARQIRKEQRELYFELLQDAKDQRARGVRRNCFMDQLLDESFRAKYELDDEHIAYIGGVLMEGGSDTTASTLLSFLLAMVKYPRVFRKAQEQVDQMCGIEHSPSFEHLAQLPYVKHCVSEVSTFSSLYSAAIIASVTNTLQVLRWRPVAAGGIPHVLVQGTPLPLAETT
jgi:cytochrome P450